MTDAAQRKALLEEIERQRDCRALLYVTGDRPGLETQIGQDVVDLFVDHLDAIGPVPKISLILYTKGGDTSAAWNLVNLIRMFCEKFEVIVPSKCRSAGTLICLGADQVVMTKQATLGPVDPAVTGPLGPEIPGATGEARAPVSVEAVNGYLGAVERYGGEKAAAKALRDLADKVHPLVLGQVFRARQQIRDLAQRLLEQRLEDSKAVERIVEFLCSDSGSHDYTINRREAGTLGLPVEKCSPGLYETVKAISDSYSQQMEFRHASTMAQRGLPLGEWLHEKHEGKPINFEYTRAIIESVAHAPQAFASGGVVEVIHDRDRWETREHRLTEGWKDVPFET